jgi:hypothetical protein
VCPPLQALGDDAVRTLLIPNLESGSPPLVSGRLAAAMQRPADDLTRMQAQRLHGVLLHAVGTSMYDCCIKLAGSGGPVRSQQLAESLASDGSAGGKRRAGGAPAAQPGSKHARAAAGRPQAAGDDGDDDLQDVASILAASWQEDACMNRTLGALLRLFGDDLLPKLPLAQPAALVI